MGFVSTEGPQQWAMRLCSGQHCDGPQEALGSASEESLYLSPLPIMLKNCGFWSFPESLVCLEILGGGLSRDA